MFPILKEDIKRDRKMYEAARRRSSARATGKAGGALLTDKGKIRFSDNDEKSENSSHLRRKIEMIRRHFEEQQVSTNTAGRDHIRRYHLKDRRTACSDREAVQYRCCTTWPATGLPHHITGGTGTVPDLTPTPRLSCTVDSNVSWNGAGMFTSTGLEAGTTSCSISTERRLMDAYRPKLVSG
ncbi:hypothetical protein J6590_027622 [Homalodisca vitripennis]|nr:hypothetical protein J6590_027622 [Homalodisca vitripennis]